MVVTGEMYSGLEQLESESFMHFGWTIPLIISCLTVCSDLRYEYSTSESENTRPASSPLEMNGSRNLPRSDGPYNECMTNIAI